MSSDESDDEDTDIDPTKHDITNTNQDRDFSATFCPPVIAAVDPSESSSSQTSRHEAPHAASTDNDLQVTNNLDVEPSNCQVVPSTTEPITEHNIYSELSLLFERPILTDDRLLFNPWLTHDGDNSEFEKRLRDFSRTIEVSTGPSDAKCSVVSPNLTIAPKYPPGLPLNIRYQVPPRNAKVVSTLEALLDPSNINDDMDIFDTANFDPSPRQPEDSDPNFNAMFRPWAWSSPRRHQPLGCDGHDHAYSRDTKRDHCQLKRGRR